MQNQTEVSFATSLQKQYAQSSNKPLTFYDCCKNNLSTVNIASMERIVKSLSVRRKKPDLSQKKIRNDASIKEDKTINTPNTEYYGVSFRQIQQRQHQQIPNICHIQKSKSQQAFRYQPTNPSGRLINFIKYKQYLEQYRSNRIKKKILRNRDLLYSDSFIEIGFTTHLSKEDKKNLIIILYFTPQFQLLQDVTFQILQYQGLVIETHPKIIKKVFPKNQTKIFIKVTLQKWPFYNPFIEISYKTQAYKRKIQEMLPLKGKLQPMLYKSIKTRQRIRGPQIPYSLRVLSQPDKIREYFPQFYLIHQNFHEKIFGAEVFFIVTEQSFLIQIIIKKNHFLYIEGTSSTEKYSQSSTLENLICDLTGLFMKNLQI